MDFNLVSNMIVAKDVSSPAGAKRKFTKLDDIHYYSLAPSPIRVRFFVIARYNTGLK